MKQHGISRKLYLELNPPTEEDNRSGQQRILDALKDAGYVDVGLSALMLRRLYPLCEKADWKLTASLNFDGSRWQIVELEAGDTSREHYGLAVDLGSTTVVMQLIDCNTGDVLAQESAYNRQIAFGEDILTRIFYCRDDAEHLEEIRLATVGTIVELMGRIGEQTGIRPEKCLSMVVAGNTTMTHFLIGMDAFCVFSSPYAVWADQPGFLKGTDLDIPIAGYVFCYPCKANYLGGDIVSGMVATDMVHRESISVFFDVGTNGELVIGNRDFLICGAGAAGPALEGGVVKTGMRAADGAVQHVKLLRSCEGQVKNSGDPIRSIEDQVRSGESQFSNSEVNAYQKENAKFRIALDVIGGGAPKGICGSGIIDLISELFLHGLLDLRGRLVPEKSDAICWRETEGEYAVSYAPGLWFYQSDINEFIRTKAAAYTMMEYLLSETGIGMDQVDTSHIENSTAECASQSEDASKWADTVKDFYMAGAFGSHVDKESAINIGMYPDVNPEWIHTEGNTSLEGARRLLLDQSILEELPQILDRMTYVQFGAVEDFLEKMVAASALPHTDLERYPSVKARLQACSACVPDDGQYE